jgi:hypothetical protein
VKKWKCKCSAWKRDFKKYNRLPNVDDAMNSLLMHLGAAVKAAVDAAATAAVQNNNNSNPITPQPMFTVSSDSPPNATSAYSSPLAASASAVSPSTMSTATTTTTVMTGLRDGQFSKAEGFTLRPVTITTSASVVEGTPRVQVQAVPQYHGICDNNVSSGSFKIIKTSINGISVS